MPASGTSKRLAKLPALSVRYRGKLGWAVADGDRDRLLELCKLLPGRSSSLISVLWPLYVLGREKNRELRGSHDELQAKLGSKLSRKTFITTLATLKEHGLIHVDVQCEKGQPKKFTRIGVRESLYIMMFNTRTHAKYLFKYPIEDLYAAVRVVNAGEEELSLGSLGRHTDAQHRAIREILELVSKHGLSYGHFAVLRIMCEKFLELREATGWNPKFPFYHALVEGERRYWPNVLKVFKDHGGVQFLTTWAYCAYVGQAELFGNSYNVNINDPDGWSTITGFVEVECGHKRGDVLLDLSEIGTGNGGRGALRDLFLTGYDAVQSRGDFKKYLHDLFSW
ncbi:hypothetical protein [Cerasicoccus fimbriatus]|uniref:hypothetical protein n=1 Tax=Cerasicoccus fimbriatus TaxID=3014554 RepID=UPI0022B2B965|nr:hypothetical protein [Cerasicoccus sp. TK19100]